MRLAVVLLLVALVLIPNADSWGRRRWFRIRIRIRRIVRTIGTAGAIIKWAGKRDVKTFDLNNDGNIDQSEAEKILEERDAESVLSLADEDGDSNVSVAEFEEVLRRLAERDVGFDETLERDPETNLPLE